MTNIPKPKERVVILNEKIIKNNWDLIKDDEFFPGDRFSTVEEFITAVKAGDVMVGGARLIIQNKLPKV